MGEVEACPMRSLDAPVKLDSMNRTDDSDNNDK